MKLREHSESFLERCLEIARKEKKRTIKESCIKFSRNSFYVVGGDQNPLLKRDLEHSQLVKYIVK